MSRDWTELKASTRDFEGWAALLRTLLDEAADATRSDDVSKRLAAQKELNRFIDSSPNLIARRLDDIAEQAIHDIFKQSVEETLASLASRSADLSRHTKEIEGITEKAQKDAASIRLERATKAVGLLTEAISAISELRNDLPETADAEGGGGADDIQAKVAEAVKIAQKAREIIEALKAGI